MPSNNPLCIEYVTVCTVEPTLLIADTSLERHSLMCWSAAEPIHSNLQVAYTSIFSIMDCNSYVQIDDWQRCVTLLADVCMCATCNVAGSQDYSFGPHYWYFQPILNSFHFPYGQFSKNWKSSWDMLCTVDNVARCIDSCFPGSFLSSKTIEL